MAALAVAAGAYFGFFRGTDGGAEVEFRYEEVETRLLVRSVSATGRLVPQTTVDVRSLAGGTILRMLVEEGDFVEEGDLIAIIDPEDTRAVFSQAEADVRAAEARVENARRSVDLERRNADIRVRDAQAALELSRNRLERVRLDTQTQPALVQATIRTAELNLQTRRQELTQLRSIEIPNRRRETEVALNQTRVARDTARAELERQRDLLERGYTSVAAVEQAQSSFESANSNYQVAQERARTLDEQIEIDLRNAEARVAQAEADLEQAGVNRDRLQLNQNDLREAEKAVERAELDLQNAENARLNVQIRQTDVNVQSAQAVRSQVTLDNAEFQLRSTNVVAPRSGIVTEKYQEEGTVIPPGTSAFSDGTALVQISDVTTMFVEVLVDESDIASVFEDQDVNVTVEAFPGRPLRARVVKIFPQADPGSNITRIRVRVEILPEELERARESNNPITLRPGMNAACEFLMLEKPDVIVIPNQAIQREDGRTFVRVRTEDEFRPREVDVELGARGNTGVEVVSGLEVGMEIVTGEINLRELRERQARMQALESGGGFGGVR